MKILFSLVTLALSLTALPAQAILISDGDFNSWSFGSTGTATVSRENSGGNPGARLNITTVSGTTVYGTAVKNDFSTFANIDGAAFDFNIEVLSGPGSFGQGQRIQLLAEQNSNIWATNLGITGYPLNWDTFSYSGVLDETSFTLFSGSGSTPLDLSGGTETFFGFAGGNSISGTLTQYYDNFSLEITPRSVPAPSTLGLFLLGLFGVAQTGKSKQKSNRHGIQRRIP